MTEDEKRAYSRGYAAGKRRKLKDNAGKRERAHRRAFWERALLAALPACIEAQGWKRGEQPITDIKARTGLAVDFANEALRQLDLYY